MANNNFIVKNGLTVNGSFTANSTAVNAAVITATSVNTASVGIGANVSVNTTILFIGNNTVNTNVSAGQISISGAIINSSSFSGTANNSTNFNGQAASFYANALNITTGTLATARLGTGTANSTTFLSGDQTYKTAVTSVSSGSGLSGSITTTGSLSINANNGVTANTTGLFVNANNGLLANTTGVHIRANNGISANATGAYVVQGTGTVVNATGVHVNTNFIATLTVNSSVFSTSSPTNTFTVGTTGYFVANGNFGLANSSPIYKMTVNGITSSGDIAATSNQSTPMQIHTRNAGGTGDTNVAGVSFQCSGSYLAHMHLRADGYFGLSQGSGTSWRWFLNMNNGDMVAAGNITAYSDPRLKEVIGAIETPLEKVNKLNGVKFRWKQNSILGAPGSEDYGILANEVAEIMPEIVKDSIHDSNEGDKYKTVAYDKLIPLLIESIKELNKKIEELEKKVI